MDGKTTSGRLKLYFSTSSGNLSTAMVDPLTKRTLDLNVTNSTFSKDVILTPQFRAGGSARTQVLILVAPNATQMWGFDGVGGNQGVLQASSGVLLTLGSQSLLVKLNQTTGLVTLN